MYNKIILVGRLTADPELKQTPSGVSVTSFSLAVDRSYTPKGGERQADFFDIVAWRQTAEFITRFFSKGRSILVEGEMQSRSYVDKNGQNRRAWEVIVDNARFVESKNASGAQPSGRPEFPPEPPSLSAPQPSFSSGSIEDFTEIDDDDGDLPF